MKWSSAQSQAIVTQNRNLVISAGAGSGKTAVLVERVLQLLEADATLHIEHFLVMTFTEAAAGEMRQRLADGLHARMAEAQKRQASSELARLRREIEALWQAQISTIHSFCLDIVSRNALLLNLAPNFRLLDENERRVQLISIAERIVEQSLAGEASHAVREMMVQLRLTDVRHLVRVLLRLYELARSQVSPNEWLHQVAKAYPANPDKLADTPLAVPFYAWIDENLEMADQYFTRAAEIAFHIEELEKYSAWLQEACARLQQAKTAVNAADIDAAADALYFWISGKSPSTRYKGSEAQQVKSLREAGNKIIKKIAAVVVRGESALLADVVQLSPHVDMLCQLTSDLLTESEAHKQAHGVLDFNDLEHLAFAVLKHPDAGEATRLQHVFRHVFVDEYQDTSPIQDALVDIVTQNQDNLFAVGDVKQSIYRFRMAEPGLFLRRYGAYQAGQGGLAIDLIENYRSQREIVSFINFTFAQLFREETTDFAYDDHARMVSAASYPRAATDDAALVEVHLMERSTRDDEVDDESSETNEQVDLSAIEREAQVVARRVNEMLAQDNVQVWDKSLGLMRPIVPKDIAVLLRSGRGALNTVLDVLRARGIDATASTSTGFYDALEVKWLLAALRVIDNPQDDVAVVTFLRSPLCGWDENMLAAVRLVHRGSFWDALNKLRRQAGEELETLLPSVSKDALAALKSAANVVCERVALWRVKSRRVGVCELLQQVVVDTECLQYFDGMTRGQARRANVAQLLKVARAYDERTGYAGLFGFVQQCEREDAADLDLGAATPTVEDAVQVMTIHRSKGLEFPVVFVIDLGKQFRLTQEDMYLNRTYGVGIVAYDQATQQRWHTMSSIAVSHAERRATLAEEARILYVALTRARERLILVGSAQDLVKKLDVALYAHDQHRQALLPGAFMQAKSYMDWLLPVFLRHPKAQSVHRLLDGSVWDRHVWSTEAGDVHFQVYVDDNAQMHNPNLPNVEREDTSAADEAIQDWYQLIADAAAVATDVSSIHIIEDAEEAVQSLYGKVSATDMRRLHVALMQNDKQRPARGAAASLLEDPVFVRPDTTTPREEGVAFHQFMQRVPLPIGDTPSDVMAALADLVKRGVLAEETARVVNVQQATNFLQSPLGKRMREAVHIYREQPFFHRIDAPVHQQDGTMPIVVQGVIDCLIEEEHEWVVIDYKTDNVNQLEAVNQANEYTAQVATYLEALKPLTRTKPVRAYLYFVRADTAIEVPPMRLPDVFVALQRKMTTHQTEI